MTTKGHQTILLALLVLGWGCRSAPELPEPPDLSETREYWVHPEGQEEMLSDSAALTRDPRNVVRARMNTLSSFQDSYVVGAGDVIEIIYNFRYELTPEEYIIEIQDDLQVEFLFNPELSRKATVRMDGKITLPLIGEIEAANSTAPELGQRITERSRRFIKNPEVSVNVIRGNVKIDELKKAITTAERGQSKIVPVRPDGMISLPLIGDVQAAGLTIPEIRYEVNRAYAPLVRNLETSVILQQVISPRIFVLGEVERPGVYPTSGPVTTLQAVTMAGGLKDSAKRNSVVVLRDVGLPVPRGIRIDFDQLFNLKESSLSQAWEKRKQELAEMMGESRDSEAAERLYAGLGNWNFINNDLVLQTNDIVYVPKTFISGVNTFIDQWFTQGLYSLLPADSTMQFILDTWDVIHIDERRRYQINETID